MNKFDLNNRVAVVTGGAQGFGFAITERFIQSGAKVIIWDIDKEAAEIALKKINSERCFYQIVDVKNFEGIIKNLNDIENNPIILYMKGTKERPMCGFSARVVNTLNSHSVVFQDINVLEDPEIRVRLSEYSNWPTIPQLFVNGELIGGCDIVMEMESKGELRDVLKKTEA